MAARDELTVTGGSLYFLGHRGVVEGSVRVTLETLDEVSGLPVRATPLTGGETLALAEQRVLVRWTPV